MSTPQTTRPAEPKRINVAVNAEMLAAIDHVIERDHVSLTEAVRRLVAYGDHLSRAVADEGVEVLYKYPDGRVREVKLLTD